MHAFHAQQISLRTETGDTLFQDLSCQPTVRLTGLTGRNGIGKTLLGEVLSGKRPPTSGTLRLNAPCGIYRQHNATTQQSRSLAAGLGLEDALKALTHIEQGSVDEGWFDMLNERWDCRQRFAQCCQELALPPVPDRPFSALSGGQQARITLWNLFQQTDSWLLLDEPSNHLDIAGKHWLLAQIQQFPGPILLISHDRFLLRAMEEIWELNEHGLQRYGGNYDTFATLKHQQQAALDRQLTSASKALQLARRQAQLSKEKAERRAAQGNRLARSGSQAKILLDGKKEQAGAAAAARVTRTENQQRQLQSRLAELKARQAATPALKITPGEAETGKHTLVQMSEGILPFGQQPPLSFSLRQGEKLRLCGNNGCGKSTLLRVLRQEISLQAGRLWLGGGCSYLDQHYRLLNPQLSLLEALSEGMIKAESLRRTLLAQAGFRREQVQQKVAELSGGEKMKLAMLIVSHQPDTPLLLLDEPDNHLDLDARAALAQALASWPGALILVTHDDDFARECQLTGEIVLA